MLISLGSKVLRETFDRIIPPQSLQCTLKRNPAHAKLQSRRNEGILNCFQWSKLYPTTPSEVSSAGFDIPLLMVLLRTICDLSPPPAGWDAPPLPEDLSRESDIARLKYFMNAVSSHAGEGFVSDAVFSSHWQQIHDTMVRLGGADYEDFINEMRDQEMDVLSEEHFRELLKQWRNADDNIKDKLKQLESVEAVNVAGELCWQKTLLLFKFLWFILSVRPTIGIHECRFHCVFSLKIPRIQCASPCLAVCKPRSSYLVGFGK